jgi:hypothetical protein
MVIVNNNLVHHPLAMDRLYHVTYQEEPSSTYGMKLDVVVYGLKIWKH